jgi:hypothetical protein
MLLSNHDSRLPRRSSLAKAGDFLVMGDPFKTYNDEVDRFLSQPRAVNANTDSDQQ